jgi:hypothetical protein
MAILVIAIASIMTTVDVSWGYIEVYIASYLYSFSDSITTSKVHMIYTMIDIGQIIGAQIFHLVTSRLGYREALSLALALNAIAWLICYMSTTIWGFIFPALLWGIAIALRFLTCSFYMVELMPDNYALAVGLGNLSAPTSYIFWS